jgi:hypothetical protein
MVKSKKRKKMAGNKKKIVRKKSKKFKVGEKSKEREELLLQPPRGMKDILPEEQPYWDQVRRVSEKLARDYGFARIDLPLLEYTNLFSRGIGEGTDVIEKEMYSFLTRGGDKVSLRPEFTAGVCRAYIQHGMNILSKPNFFRLVRLIAMNGRKKAAIGSTTKLIMMLLENRMRF